METKVEGRVGYLAEGFWKELGSWECVGQSSGVARSVTHTEFRKQN